MKFILRALGCCQLMALVVTSSSGEAYLEVQMDLASYVYPEGEWVTGFMEPRGVVWPVGPARDHFEMEAWKWVQSVASLQWEPFPQDGCTSLAW